MALPDNHRREGPWSGGVLMPQCRGMLEWWGGRVWVDRRVPLYRQRGGSRADVGLGQGVGGGVTS